MTATTNTLDGQQATPAAPPAGKRGPYTSTGLIGDLAGLLMVTGIAWNAGLEAVPFHPVMNGVAALMVHVTPLAAVMACLAMYVRSGREGSSRGRGLTVAAWLAIGFGAFSAIFSVTHPHAVMGVHNVNDILPIAILDAGAVLWLVRGRPAGARKAQRTANRLAHGSTASAAA